MTVLARTTRDLPGRPFDTSTAYRWKELAGAVSSLALVPTHVLCSGHPGVFVTVKGPIRDAYHHFNLVPGPRNAWSSISPSSYAFFAFCLIEQKETLLLLLLLLFYNFYCSYCYVIESSTT
jgi:hypothetical protein